MQLVENINDENLSEVTPALYLLYDKQIRPLFLDI
jgi:hypothetical protein